MYEFICVMVNEDKEAWKESRREEDGCVQLQLLRAGGAKERIQ